MPNTCENYEKKCGGCPLLTLPYPEQVAKKQARVSTLLGHYAPVEPLRAMQEPWHYRNKAIATFAMQRGKLVLGLYAEGSHRVLPGCQCLLQSEVLNRTLSAVLDAARACRWVAYDEDRGTGLVRHAVLRTSREGKVLVTLVTARPELPGSRNFCTALRKAAPWVVGIVQNINPTQTSAVLGNREKTLFGRDFVADTLCGLQFAISSRSFYQVNPVQTEVLYQTALELAALTGKETVLDAYCGIGTIGLCAAARAGRVIGVERNPAAARDAAANARLNRIANAEFVCADATEWMIQQADKLRPDVIFLDPPRAGSTPECIAAVAKMNPRRVIYVSCDPETLARDIVLFGRNGYRARRCLPVDLFPHTKHVETVCLLSKLNEAKHHVNVKLDMDEMDLTAAESKATYEEIKAYVAEHNDGMKVSNLYIAQVKAKYGIIERENYNKPKSDDARQPKCPKEKENAIVEALRYFRMI